MGKLTEAARDVLAERDRQIEKEGWDARHDDQHNGGELAVAAACYADPHDWQQGTDDSGAARWYPGRWPWAIDWWKMKSYRQNLVRAGALIIAEIERLDRLPSAPPHNQEGA